MLLAHGTTLIYKEKFLLGWNAVSLLDTFDTDIVLYVLLIKNKEFYQIKTNELFLSAKPNLEFPKDQSEKGKSRLINGVLGT